MKFAPIVLRVLLAMPLIIFGLNKFVGFMEMPLPDEGSMAATFMMTMYGTYLAKFVALGEIVGGLMLLMKKTSALGAIIVMPILLNILAFHLFVDGEMSGIGMGVMLVVFDAAILYFNRERLLPILGDNGAA